MVARFLLRLVVNRAMREIVNNILGDAQESAQKSATLARCPARYVDGVVSGKEDKNPDLCPD
jgi:hypothetical protein